MTLSSSLSAALSGLSVTSLRAQVVSSNVANADTEGYAVRRLEVASQTMGEQGAGVKSQGIMRHVDLARLQDRRFAEGEKEAATVASAFLRDMEALIGTPDTEGSLGAQVTRLEASLVEAAARPESQARLNDVVNASVELASKFNAISDGIQEQRQTADRAISDTVDRLNIALEQVAELNGQIRRSFGTGRDAATLMDARQSLIDEVAREIPLRQLDRGRGQVALLGTGGIMLVDAGHAQLAFDARGLIAPEMDVASGGLSQINVNGKAVDALAAQKPFGDGRLSALFELRDDLAVQAQTRVDSVARDLMERFEGVADVTRGVGSAALFTDDGASFDASAELGLAARMQVNANVIASPQLVRDGLGAAVIGPVGESALLQGFASALSSARTPASADFSSGARTMSDLSSDFLTMVSTQRASADRKSAFTGAKFEALRADELAGGVDTDTEMQLLLRIEQAYAANAKVIEVVGNMFETLQRIG